MAQSYNPIISVVIPAYNASATLERCIQSVIHAGIEKVEIIVIDDGSRDNTERLMQKIPGPVRYLKQSNQGPASARNLGISISNGNYLSFLDSDDTWDVGALPYLVQAMEDYKNIDLLFTDAQMGNERSGYRSVVEEYGGTVFGNLPRKQLGDNLFLLDKWPLFRCLAQRNVIFLGSCLFRTEAVKRLGGFAQELFGSEDWDLVLRTAATGNVAFWNGTPLAKYIKHAGSISSNLDRMNENFAKALHHVHSVCTLPDDLRKFVYQRERQTWYGWIYRSYDSGDTRRVKEKFSIARKNGEVPVSALLLYIICHLPKEIIKKTRFLFRAAKRLAQRETNTVSLQLK